MAALHYQAVHTERGINKEGKVGKRVMIVKIVFACKDKGDSNNKGQ